MTRAETYGTPVPGYPAAYTSHVDTFARDRLPPPSQWPLLTFDRPELQYPERINCGVVLCDDAVAEGHGDRVAIHSDAGVWTYRHLLEQANRIANVLVRELGVVPGNRVLLRAANGPMLACAWLAVMKAGAIAVTTMPLLRAKELRQIAAKAAIRHCLCDARLRDELDKASGESGWLGSTLTWGDGALEARMAAQPATFANVDTASDDVCLLAFTSGTTGEPKATMHFHRDVLAMADVVGRHLLETSPDDVYIGSPPLGFTFGLGALLVFPLRFRGAVAYVEQPSPDSLLEAVQKFGGTCLFTAPTMYRALAPLARRFDLRTLRRSVSAGEPLARATSDLWYSATGIRLIDGLGATEMIHIFISAKGDDIRPGATGKPLPGYEATILDDDHRPLPRGHSGRLAVRGPTGCRYLDDPRQAEYVVDGWNVTGDRYRVDADGYFWFESRADDMIISGGYNIAGAEVEAALLAHPAVREVAVIGAPDEERGHIVKAFVVPQAGHAAGPELRRELQDFVKATVAPYKYPRAIEFLDALPKTPTGKVQRYVLRQQERSRGELPGTQPMHQILSPPGWPRPKGYSNGVAAFGRLVFVAGQIGWNERGEFPRADLPGQIEQTLRNTLAVLKEAGAGPQHVVRQTWYVTSRDEYLENARAIGEVWRALMGRNYPAIAVVQVTALMEAAAKVEIETTAVVPQHEDAKQP
ncbi:MAG: AMP-binding protein [Steroidobacteraceae bacterium]|jgi:2-aminobenzoate-CoA ligase|nr:AMP-binding protein [Steroidobacteraceae bacterium]